jgi:hypothetical protein
MKILGMTDSQTSVHPTNHLMKGGFDSGTDQGSPRYLIFVFPQTCPLPLFGYRLCTWTKFLHSMRFIPRPQRRFLRLFFAMQFRFLFGRCNGFEY